MIMSNNWLFFTFPVNQVWDCVSAREQKVHLTLCDIILIFLFTISNTVPLLAYIYYCTFIVFRTYAVHRYFPVTD